VFREGIALEGTPHNNALKLTGAPWQDGARPQLNAVLGGHRSNGLRRLATITAVTAVLSAPTSANALEVDASVAGIMYFGCCSWSLRIAPDGTTTVTVSPAEHLSRRFRLSPAKMRELETLVRREDFLSLDEALGALVVDGPDANISITLDAHERTISLRSLPSELVPVWRKDAGQLGRAFRVCEYLRSLTGVPKAMHCPGIPEATE